MAQIANVEAAVETIGLEITAIGAERARVLSDLLLVACPSVLAELSGIDPESPAISADVSSVAPDLTAIHSYTGTVPAPAHNRV